MNLMGDNDIKVDLATATASPPPWFSKRYPDSLPITADGIKLLAGFSAAVLSEQSGLSKGDCRTRHKTRTTLPTTSGSSNVAYRKRIRLPHARMLLRHFQQLRFANG